MSTFARICDAFSEYEDDDLWRTLWKLYGPLLQLSLLLPSFRPSHRHLTFITFIFYVLLLPLQFIILTISAILVLDDFPLFSLLAHYWLYLTYAVSVVIMFTLPRFRRSTAANHRFLVSDMGKYQHGDIYKEEIPLKIDEDIKRQTLRFLAVPAFVGVAVAIVFILPYLINFNSGVSYVESGVNMNLVIPMYYPWQTDKGVGHFLTVGYQSASIGGAGLVIIASMFLYLRVATRVRIEYQVLGYALDTLFQRASAVFEEKYPRKTWTLSDPLYQRCVEACLKECVVHHHNIVKLMGGFDEVGRWPSIVCYGVGCINLAGSLANILLAISEADHEKIIMFCVMAIGEVTAMGMVSLVGEMVTTDSVAIRDRLYDIKWYNIDVKNRKVMLNFQVGVTEPVVMKAGVNLPICLDTFANIINTAYSFFNLMNANMA